MNYPHAKKTLAASCSKEQGNQGFYDSEISEAKVGKGPDQVPLRVPALF